MVPSRKVRKREGIERKVRAVEVILYREKAVARETQQGRVVYFSFSLSLAIFFSFSYLTIGDHPQHTQSMALKVKKKKK